MGLPSQLDGYLEDADQIEAAIVVAARELLARPVPRRWIKLEAVRGRSPLTQTASPYDAEVHPETLQLSDTLLSDLALWNAYFAAALSDWPEGGGFESEQDAERFVAAGRQLVLQLQEELGPSYYVEYMPEPIRPPGVKLRTR